MNNRQSYLDSMNAGRRRRPSTSLEQLSSTLDELESRLERMRPAREPRSEAAGLRTRSQRLSSATAHTPPYEPAAPRRAAYAAAPASMGAGTGSRPRFERSAGDRREPYGARALNERAVADELNTLRAELRQQMSAGLREEFARLKEDIRHALHTAAPASHVAELSVEFERLAAMIHKMSGQPGDRQIALLRDEMEDMKRALGQMAREDTVRAFDRRWDELDQRWSDIASHLQQDRHDTAGHAALDSLSARLEQIGDAVKALPTSVSMLALEDEMRALSGTVERIAHRQDRIAPETLATIEDRLEEIARAIETSVSASVSSMQGEPFERLEQRIAMMARQLEEVVEDNNSHSLGVQIEVLARRMDEIADRVDIPGATIDRLAAQIEQISRKLDETPQAGDIDDVFRGIEDRFLSLSATLQQRQDDALAQDNYLLETMDARFAELAARIDQKSTAQDDRAIREFEARLDAISSHIETAPQQAGVDPNLIRSLEAQIAGLTAHIAQPQPSAETAQLLPRLDQIEQSIAAGRHDVMEAARQAAEEAVRAFQPGTGEGLLVVGLVEDLKSLETLTRKSDERNGKTFEAIHDTLLKIVDRLGAVETLQTATRERTFGMKDTPSIAPADDAVTLDSLGVEAELDLEGAALDTTKAEADGTVKKRRSMLGGLSRAFTGRKATEQKAATAADQAVTDGASAPSAAPAIDPEVRIDPELANRPLEPGSGAPDLNAIMRRVRDERGQSGRGAEADAAKADFIAAARRAAQAAAAEAGGMKKQAAEPATKGGSGSLLNTLKGRRKPVLMGVAAVLLALAALQYGKGLMGQGQVEIADAVEPTATEIAEAAADPVAVPPMAETSVQASEAASTDWLNVEAASPIETQAVEETAAEDSAAATEEIAPAVEAPQAQAETIPLDAGPLPLREAAAAGDAKALFEIGNRYAEGRGGDVNMSAAADYYRKAAEQGLAPAQYRIGNMYEKGNGVERDVAQAKTWYQLAAEQGNAAAMHNLAVLFAMGADGTTDNESAARWFSRAAEFGVTDSQFNLAILSAKGVGLTQNLSEAYKWFALVAQSGDKDAAEKRDEVAKALRPEQLETARAAVELWRAKTPSAEANDVASPESWSEDTTTTASVDMTQAVRNIQHILNKNGYAAGTEDGLMGQKTVAAIAAFQKDNGMLATGEVDEALVKALLERR